MHHKSRGQAMVVMLTALVAVIGMAGFTIDLGHVYFDYQRLQNATQAAALAGASVLSNDTAANATTAAKNYSALSGDRNTISDLTNVSLVSG